MMRVTESTMALVCCSGLLAAPASPGESLIATRGGLQGQRIDGADSRVQAVPVLGEADDAPREGLDVDQVDGRDVLAHRRLRRLQHLPRLVLVAWKSWKMVSVVYNKVSMKPSNAPI